MKFIKIISAYNSAKHLLTMKLEKYFSYGVYKVVKRFQSDYDFYAQRERELVCKYGQCDEKGNPIINDENKFTFKDAEAAKRYALEHAELDNMEIELDGYVRPRVPWPDNIELQYILALEDFIEFVAPEE